MGIIDIHTTFSVAATKIRLIPRSFIEIDFREILTMNSNEEVDTIGTVKATKHPERSGMSKTSGKPYRVKDFNLINNRNEAIALSMWYTDIDLVAPMLVNKRVAFSNLVLETYPFKDNKLKFVLNTTFEILDDSWD